MSNITFEEWLFGQYHTIEENDILIHNRNRRSLAVKVGNFAGKTVKFFQAKETKASFLIGNWAGDTIAAFFAAIVFAPIIPLISIIVVLGWFYHTYCLYGAIETLVTNG
jgi:fatty acid desaturase